MTYKMGSVHEPEAKLLSAEDVIEDVARLREARRVRRKSERAVPMRVPLWVLLEAIDALEPRDLQQVAHRVKERLMVAAH